MPVTPLNLWIKTLPAISGEVARDCGMPADLQAELLRLCARIGYSPPRL